MSERRVLVELDLDGDVRGFVVDEEAEHVTLPDGSLRSYVPGVSLTELPPRVAPIFGEAVGAPSVRATLQLAVLDLWMLRDRVRAQRIEGRIYWWPAGEVLRPRHEIYRGSVRNPSWDIALGLDGQQSGAFSFDLVPPEHTADAAFPPAMIGDEGRFSTAPDSASGRAVPVIYGAVSGLPLYAVTDPAVNPVRLIIAGHPVSPNPFGISVYDGSDGSLVVAGLTEQTGIDGFGATYTYVEVTPAQYTGAAGNLYALSAFGWPHHDTSKGAISGLGDMLLHAWTTYANEDFYELDRERAWRARVPLNRYTVSVLFNSRVEGATVMRAIAGRLVPQFPFVAGFAGGRFGWDATVFPQDESVRPVRELTYGQDAFDRVALAETSIDQIVTSADLNYAIDYFDGTNTGSIRLDRNNDGSMRRAYARWGETATLKLQASDVSSAGTAYVLLAEIARRRSRVRYLVEYADLDPEWYDLPLFEQVAVTDVELGWVREPCIIEALRPQLNGRAGAVLVSIRSA